MMLTHVKRREHDGRTTTQSGLRTRQSCGFFAPAVRARALYGRVKRPEYNTSGNRGNTARRLCAVVETRPPSIRWVQLNTKEAIMARSSNAASSGDLDHQLYLIDLQLYLIERHAGALRAIGMIALEAASPGHGLHLLGGEDLCSLCGVMDDSIDASTAQAAETLK